MSIYHKCMYTVNDNNVYVDLYNATREFIRLFESIYLCRRMQAPVYRYKLQFTWKVRKERVRFNVVNEFDSLFSFTVKECMYYELQISTSVQVTEIIPHS